MDNQIVLNDVNYIYSNKTKYARHALVDINLTINHGEFVALIGKTGSGKSTLIHLLNGLLRPTSGKVRVNQHVVSQKMTKAELLDLRSQVGMIFQSPEKQLFADTVLDDVAFGPQNFGKSKNEAELLAKRILKLVGIDETLFNRSPFELSGGQMRRVAIAGVLVMNPSILILDEPTVGLDEIGRREILTMISKINRQQGVTVLLITHNMKAVSEFAKRVIMLDQGKLISDSTTQQFFKEYKNEFVLPDPVKIYQNLKKHGIKLDEVPLNKHQLVDLIMKKLAE